MTMTKPTLLVVDDEPDIVKTVVIALELLGYEVNTAVTGTDAIDKIRLRPPDLLIIDMVIPRMSGKDVARWIKDQEEYKHIPIILITALAQKYKKEAFEEKEVECYLIKLFDLNQLGVKVQELLNISLSNPQP